MKRQTLSNGSAMLGSAVLAAAGRPVFAASSDFFSATDRTQTAELGMISSRESNSPARLCWKENLWNNPAHTKVKNISERAGNRCFR